MHRDIKPGNFLTKKGEVTIYIIDFGLAHSYLDAKGKHIPYSDGKGMVGTARYASIRTHMGIEQTRRDDLFSLGYLMIYWLKGGLPWQGIKAKNKKEKNSKIKDLKIAISFDTLSKDLPKEFEEYFKICYKLSFTETPNYHSLRKLFKPEIGLPLDWEVLKKEETKSEIV